MLIVSPLYPFLTDTTKMFVCCSLVRVTVILNFYVVGLKLGSLGARELNSIFMCHRCCASMRNADENIKQKFF